VNTGTHRLTQRWQKSLKMPETLWKNSHIIAKDVRIIGVDVIIVAISFFEENIGLTSVPLLLFQQMAKQPFSETSRKQIVQVLENKMLN
jgi:hypothetical protein